MVQATQETAFLTKLGDRWRTAIWLGKSDRSDEHIIGWRMEQSWHDQFDGKSKASARMKEC